MYSIDFKKQAVKYKENGHTFKELNEAFNISAQTYYDWKKKFEQGYFEKKTKQTRRRKIDKEKLKLAIEEKPDAYLREIAEKFNCSEQAVFYALKRMNITYKKNIHIFGKIRNKKG